MRGARTSNNVSRRRSGVGRVFRPGRLFRRRLRNSPAITRIRTPSAHLHQTVAPLPVLADVSYRAAQLVFRRRMSDERLRFAARQFKDVFIANDVGDAQGGQPGLLGSEKFARAAQLQIHFGDVEAVARFHHGPDAFARGSRRACP